MVLAKASSLTVGMGRTNPSTAANLMGDDGELIGQQGCGASEHNAISQQRQLASTIQKPQRFQGNASSRIWSCACSNVLHVSHLGGHMPHMGDPFWLQSRMLVMHSCCQMHVKSLCALRYAVHLYAGRVSHTLHSCIEIGAQINCSWTDCIQCCWVCLVIRA